jgi:hypothetical protein
MTDKKIKKYLASEEIGFVENQIAEATNRFVNKEHLDFTVDIVKRDVSNSDFDFMTITKLISNSSDSLIKFGTLLINNTKTDKIEEEYPVGEEPEEHGKSVVIKDEGLGIGFSIQYAIYYLYLISRRIEDLKGYLKKSRIPKADKFAKELIEIINNQIEN